ncbi:ATP-binding cassette domain-containing protein [Exiguobacterium artemiae]|uniref:ATP-binding cassette domain-containing protein n=1 Tax=Exiguobacterium artemiae TaxID=340145 RepID=UPI003CFE7707
MVYVAAKFLFILQFSSKLLLGLTPFFNMFLIEKFFSSIIDMNKNSSYSDPLLISLVIALLNFSIFFINSSNQWLQKKISFHFEIFIKTKHLVNSKKIPYINYENADFQNKYMRIINSQHQILSSVNTTLILIQSSISIVSIVWYLCKINIYFLLIIFIMVIPLILMELKFGTKAFSLYIEMSESKRKVTYLENILSNKSFLKEIKLNELEHHFISLWNKRIKKNFSKEIKLESEQIKSLSLVQIIVAASFVFSTFLVVFSVSKGSLTIATLPAVIQGIQNLQGILPIFASNIADTHNTNLGIGELRRFLNEYTEDTTNHSTTVDSIEKIEICNLSFNYPSRNSFALSNVSFKINRKEKIAIMGSNGSGKSTLIKCITGLYDTKDMIVINDKHKLENINRSSYWSDISVLFQDFNKYELSIKDNVQLKHEDNNKKLWSSIQLVGLESKINDFHSGMDTRLGNLFSGGEELSGGQWQKIAIARTLYKDSNFLFLDEPTAALDPDSEFHITKNLLSQFDSKGIVFITHRVNIAKMADTIIYLENGEVIEKGSHKELVDLRGKYAAMYERQLHHLVEEKGEHSYA